MATTRIFTSKNRTGIERATPIAVLSGQHFVGRWELVKAASEAWNAAIRIQISAEFSDDNGNTWTEFKRTTVTGEQPARGSTGGPIDVTAPSDGLVRVTCDTSGTWRYAVDLITA